MVSSSHSIPLHRGSTALREVPGELCLHVGTTHEIPSLQAAQCLCSAHLCPLTHTVLLMGVCNTPELTGNVACSIPATLTCCGLDLKRKQVTTWSPFCAGRLDTACRLMRSLPRLINMSYHWHQLLSLWVSDNTKSSSSAAEGTTKDTELQQLWIKAEISQLSLLRPIALVPQRSHSVPLEIIQEFDLIIQLQHRLSKAFGKARPLKF